MSKQSPLRDFNSFEDSLRQTGLPGTKNPSLLREIYALAKRSEHLEDKGEKSVAQVAKKYRPMIRHSRAVLSALERVQKCLAEAQRRCERMYPESQFCQSVFQPAFLSLSELVRNIESNKHLFIDQLHPRSLRKGETQRWELLLPEYDYPLKRLGYKVVETQFLTELSALLSQHFKTTRRGPAESDRRKLIQAVFQAAFGLKKEETAIKQALARIPKREKESPAR